MRSFVLKAVLALAGISFVWIPGSHSTEAGGTLPIPQEKLIFRCLLGGTELCTMNPDGSEKGFITSQPAVGDNDPEVSPDGRWIAWTQRNEDIFVMRSDGTGMFELLDEEGVFMAPTWSPDGEKLAFTCELPGPPMVEGICIANSDGSGLNVLLEFEDPRWPKWSPDGESIMFHHVELNFNEDLYILDVDSLTTVNITDTLSDEEYARWSPDGERIAFVGGPFPGEIDVGRNLYTIDPDGTDRIMLFNPLIGAPATWPAWSPDGTEIAFMCDQTNAPNEICFVDSETGELKRRFDTPTNEMWFGLDWALFSSFIDFGDVDCNRSINSVDALQLLRDTAGLAANQEHPCPVIGEPFELPASDLELPLWGDVDCDLAVGSLDALNLLKFVAGLPPSQNEPCLDIGTPLY